MANVTSQENLPTTSTTDVCQICGGEPFCDGLGVIRYDVPVDDPRFGKLFRCPNNPVEYDTERHERLREVGNLAAFAEKVFHNFEIATDIHTPEEQQSLNLAVDVAWRFSQAPDGWLLFEGTYGCGKTHLAAAIGNECLQRGDSVLFITVPDLLDHLRAAYGPSSEIGYDETFDQMRNAPILILDDLGVENPSPWAQEKLFQLLNHRYSHQMPTIITTNADINVLDPRIRSRLLDLNLIRRVLITAPDYRSLIQNQRNQLESNLSLYEDMTFDNFDVYENSTPDERKNLEKVLRAAYSYAEQPQGWLVLMGKYGSGKTHLAAAIAQHRQVMGEEVIFLTVPDLLDYLRTAFAPDATMSFDQRFQAVRRAALLVMDDLGTESASSWAKEKLFQLIDYRYVAKLPTVITTSKEMEQLDARLQSRLLDDRISVPFAITARSYVARRKNKR